MASQTNTVMRNHIRPIVVGMLMGLAAAYVSPYREHARRTVPDKQTPKATVPQFSIEKSGWRFIVLPLCGMLFTWSSSMVGVVFIPKRLATVLESRDTSKGDAGMIFVAVTMLAGFIAALIYESSFAWEIERALKVYEGHANTYEYYPWHLCIRFRTNSIEDKNRPEIGDTDLPSIVEIVSRADRQHYWKTILVDLGYTNVTNAGVPYLERLPSGIGVTLTNTNITSDGVELLRLKRPDIHVNFKSELPAIDGIFE